MKTSLRGIEMIQQFEGRRLESYLCPAGVLTIGYGHTGADVTPGRKITQQRALTLLKQDLKKFEAGVLSAIDECNQNQFDACVSLAFNIGISGFRNSSVAKAHRRGDCQAAARAFGLWNKARVDGKLTVLAGLTRRRAAESALYLEPIDDEIEPMPQEIEPESNLSRSPIIASASIGSGTAVVSVAAENARHVKDIRDSVGDWLPWILITVAVAAGGYAIWTRVKQRRLGWA